MEIEVHPYINQQGLKKQLNFSDVEISLKNFNAGGIWFPDTEIIICGTFPPRKEYINRKGYIHYSSSKNQYWKHVDAIFGTKLFIPNSISNDTNLRICNAIAKIQFANERNVGFVDIFTKIKRKTADSSKDTDLIRVETIFDNDIFEDLLKNKIAQFVFVYSLSFKTFINELKNKYGTEILVEKPYKLGGDLLEIQKTSIGKKTIHLIYCPIHGPNSWKLKQSALQKAMNYYK